MLELSSSLIRAKAAVNGVVILTIWNFGTLQIAIGELELDRIVQLKAVRGVSDQSSAVGISGQSCARNSSNSSSQSSSEFSTKVARGSSPFTHNMRC